MLPFMHSYKLALNLSLTAALALGIVACGGSSASAGGSQVINADGSSTVFPVTEAVAEEFQETKPGVRVTVGSSGTGGGFQKFCRDETDISNASRPIKPTELEACRAAGIEFIELPVAYDGLAVVVHPNNTWVSSMTVAELKKLWEPAAQGKITRWNQIGPIVRSTSSAPASTLEHSTTSPRPSSGKKRKAAVITPPAKTTT